MPLIVSIEGNIGAGKSTLIENMRKMHTDKTKLHVILLASLGCHVFLYIFFFKLLREYIFICYITYTFLAIYLHIQVLKSMERPKINIVFLQEPVNTWERIVDINDGKNILQKYCENQRKYAFVFQMLCLQTRLRLLSDAIRDNPHADVIICERSIITDAKIFARMLYNNDKMDEIEYQVYCEWFEMMTIDMPRHEFIYLRSAPERSNARKEARNRAGEENIDIEYMNKLYLYHERLFCDENIKPLMTVDIDSVLENCYDGSSYEKTIYNILSCIHGLVNCNRADACDTAAAATDDINPNFMTICDFEGTSL